VREAYNPVFPALRAASGGAESGEMGRLFLDTTMNCGVDSTSTELFTGTFFLFLVGKKFKNAILSI
jgi:hypothetical protein